MKVRSLAKAFLREMALDLGGVPPFDPEKRRKIERGQHPFANNPAFPQQAGTGGSFAEKMASEQYRKLAHKISQVLGIPIQQVSARNGAPIVGAMMQAWQRGMQYERDHRDELQRLAIETVLNFPEFHSLREAYQNGDVRIQATLTDQVNVDDMNLHAPPPDEAERAEMNVAQIAQELNVEKDKRRFINMLIQGAAIDKNHAYEEVADTLNQLDPRLVNTYATLMSVAEWIYWVMPDQQLGAMMGQGMGAAGKGYFSTDDDGTPVIVAEALVFPVLIQELVKAIMEYMSWFAQRESGTDAETFQRVTRETDTMSNEIWDIMYGPAIWRQIITMIGEENRDLLRYIYTDIASKSAGEFNQLQQHILRGDPEAQQYLQNLVATLRREQQGGEEPPPEEGPAPEPTAPPPEPAGGAEEPREDYEKPADWWQKESKSERVARRLIG